MRASSPCNWGLDGLPRGGGTVTPRGATSGQPGRPESAGTLVQHRCSWVHCRQSAGVKGQPRDPSHTHQKIQMGLMQTNISLTRNSPKYLEQNLA